MVRTRRTTRTTGYHRSAPYNLRSRSRVNYNYYDTIAANDGNSAAAGDTKPEPLPKVCTQTYINVPFIGMFLCNYNQSCSEGDYNFSRKSNSADNNVMGAVA